MIATQSPELDEILQGFPAVKQVDPVEDAEFIRFTIQLRIDPADHPNPPQIFVLFRQSEFMQARIFGKEPKYTRLEIWLHSRGERSSLKCCGVMLKSPKLYTRPVNLGADAV